jgi:protein TonB
MHAKDNNDMGIINLPFPAGHSKYFQDNVIYIRNRNVMAAILLSLMIHLWGGWLFLQVERVVPSQQRMRLIEVSIVTPTITPLPLPILPKPIHPKIPPRSRPLPVPVVPPQPAQLAKRASQPQELKKIAESNVQSSQPLLTAKAITGTQPINTSYSPRVPAHVAAAHVVSTEALPVIEPSFDAAYLNNPVPQYPAVARRLKIQGTATIRVLVSPEGRPKTVKLEKTSGARILDDAALDAVQHWLFVPARRGEKPIAAEVNVPVRFRLN